MDVASQVTSDPTVLHRSSQLTLALTAYMPLPYGPPAERNLNVTTDVVTVPAHMNGTAQPSLPDSSVLINQPNERHV